MAAEAALSSAVELLGDLFIQKVKSLRGVKAKVELLKDELKRIQSFLIDANKKQAQDERIRNWISEIREAAQDAKDTIELFLINVENAKNNGLLKRCTGFAKRMYHRNRIGNEIESIRAKLEAIDKSRERYGIKDLDEVAESASRSQAELQRRLSPWKKDEHLVGMEDDVDKLLRKSILDEDKKGLSIAVVEGMGGIGKSTLAREIYNHPDVLADRFDCRGWVVVSSEFTPQETIKQIIFQMQSSEQDKQKVLEEMTKLEESMKDKLYLQEELKQMLHKQLEGKSYFIVLDDVWEKEHLESLITAFPNQQEKRSRLLVTTRNKITTEKYCQYVHKMKLLDPEKSWGLFLNKAFIGNTNGKCPEEFVSIGGQILEKCGGLPLAISVVGGLLIEKQSKSAWEEVLEQINSYLGRAESSVSAGRAESSVSAILELSVSAILELSYQNLSPQLKSCFLCLSFFKEDAIIPARRLVDIWVAQGLIRKEGSRAADEIARGYLNELINRSMVQIEDLSINDKVKKCRLHDLVREVCLRRAMEEIGLEIVKAGEGEATSSSKSSYKSRHRVVYGKNLEKSSSNMHLRSLFLVNVDDDSSIYLRAPSYNWKSSQLLKTIDVDGLVFKRLPYSFRYLVGLKYLRIRRHSNCVHTPLELPRWLDKLKNLEVLDAENEIVEFPNVALKMERLRLFHVKGVPHNGRLMKIENWKNIVCVKKIRLADLMECSSGLMANCSLRKLGIAIDYRIDNDSIGRARVLLEKMSNLVELHLDLYGDPSSPLARLIEEVIGHLELVTKLKLIIWTIGGERCLAASVFPPNLSHLLLANVESKDSMVELGKLPKLEYLTLGKPPSFRWTLFRMKVLHDGFPCLKALCVQGIENVEGIDIEEGGMPRLKHLKIHNCPRLEMQNLPKHTIISRS